MKNVSLLLLAVIILPLQAQAAASERKQSRSSSGTALGNFVPSADSSPKGVIAKQPSASAATSPGSEEVAIASSDAYRTIFGEIDIILKGQMNTAIPTTPISGFAPHNYKTFSLEQLQAIAVKYFLPRIRSLRTKRQEAFLLDSQAAALSHLLTAQDDRSEQERLTALASELTEKAAAIKRTVPEEKFLYAFFRSLGALVAAQHQTFIVKDPSYTQREAVTYFDRNLLLDLPDTLRKEVKLLLTKEFADVELLPVSRINALAKQATLPLKTVAAAYQKSKPKELLDVFFFEGSQSNVHVNVLEAHQLITHQNVNTPTLEAIKKEHPSEPSSLADYGTSFFEKAITTTGNPLDTLYAIEGAKYPRGKDPIIMDQEVFSLHDKKQELQSAVLSIAKDIALTEGRLKDLQTQKYPKRKERADLEATLQVQQKEKDKLDAHLKRVTLLRGIQKAAGSSLRNAYPEIEGAKVPNQSAARAVASALWSLLPSAPTLTPSTETEPKNPATIWLETVEHFADMVVTEENAAHATKGSQLEREVLSYAASDKLEKRTNAGYPHPTEEISFPEKFIDGFMATYQKLVRSKDAVMKQLLSAADYGVWKSLQPTPAAASDLSESVNINKEEIAPVADPLTALAAANGSQVASASEIHPSSSTTTGSIASITPTGEN